MSDYQQRFARHEAELRAIYLELYHDEHAYDYFCSMLERMYGQRSKALRALDANLGPEHRQGAQGIRRWGSVGDVAGKGGVVANLGRGDGTAGVHQDRGIAQHQGRLGNGRMGGQGADDQVVPFLSDLAQLFRPAIDIDKGAVGIAVVLPGVDQHVGTPGDDGDGFFHGGQGVEGVR